MMYNYAIVVVDKIPRGNLRLEKAEMPLSDAAPAFLKQTFPIACMFTEKEWKGRAAQAIYRFHLNNKVVFLASKTLKKIRIYTAGGKKYIPHISMSEKCENIGSHTLSAICLPHKQHHFNKNCTRPT